MEDEKKDEGCCGCGPKTCDGCCGEENGGDKTGQTDEAEKEPVE